MLNLTEYIERTTPLDEMEFQDLQKLFNKFPYSQTLSMLNLKFSLLAGNASPKTLKTASIYSADRRKLQDLVQNINKILVTDIKDENRGHPSRWSNIKVKHNLVGTNSNPINVSESEINNSLLESNRLHMDTISETLAQVYQKQGKYSEAIKTYEQLSLNNPEKRVYFAAQIEKLKSEQQN